MELSEVLQMLLPLTREGKLRWTHHAEADEYVADFDVGFVGITRIAFGPACFITLRDANRREPYRFEPDTGSPDARQAEALFTLAHAQALSLDPAVSRLLGEIKKRAGQG
jgi:hypothetical protein